MISVSKLIYIKNILEFYKDFWQMQVYKNIISKVPKEDRSFVSTKRIVGTNMIAIMPELQ